MTCVQPCWRRAKEYGHNGLLRLGPGDSISITISTEVGLSIEESSQLSAAHGVSLSVWAAALEATVAETYGMAVQTSARRSVTYTSNYSNSDALGRNRYVALWRPSMSCVEKTLESLRFRTRGWDDASFNDRFSHLYQPEAVFSSKLWQTSAHREFPVSGQFEHSDMYA